MQTPSPLPPHYSAPPRVLSLMSTSPDAGDLLFWEALQPCIPPVRCITLHLRPESVELIRQSLLCMDADLVKLTTSYDPEYRTCREEMLAKLEETRRLFKMLPEIATPTEGGPSHE